ncbi:hypothetical protein QR685DRAFT_568375 [Neurospora intermedia]|uniref:Uncharacterized protein n=1 Tax=Neurospora intermedia TaxID=5142 RepID=A0ABR3DSF9_NEUIN
MQSVGADCWWDKVDVFGNSQTLPPHGVRQSDQVGEGKDWELRIRNRGMDEAIWAMLPFLGCFGPKRFPKEAVKRSGGGELPKPEACELRPCEWAGAEILRLVPSNRNLKTTGLDEDGPPEVLTCCFAPSVSPPAEGTVAREKKRHYNLPSIFQQRPRGRRGKEARGDPGVPSSASNGPKRVRCMHQGHFFILIGQPLACLQDHSDVRKITPARHDNDGTVRGALPFQTTGKGRHREQGERSIMNRGPDFRNYRGPKSPGGAQRALITVQFRPGALER